MLPIETERLMLRRFEAQDAGPLSQYRSDPLVARYQSRQAMSLQEAYDFIAEQERVSIGEYDRWFQLAIVERAIGSLVGDIGICIKSPGIAAEIGFSIAPVFQRRGYGVEACAAAIDGVFHQSDANTIEAVIDTRNTSAVALVKRLGMVLERTQSALFKGEICSEHHFVCKRGIRAG